MYGTIFRFKVKPGEEERVVDVFEEWESERKSEVDGAIGGLLLKPDNWAGEFAGVALFKDKATYVANAHDPAQDKWYRKLRDLLEDDPVFPDGIVLEQVSQLAIPYVLGRVVSIG